MGMGAGAASSVVPVVPAVSSGAFPVSTSSIPASSAEGSVSATPLESVVVTEGDAPSGLTGGSVSVGGADTLSEGLGRASREWLTAVSLNP